VAPPVELALSVSMPSDPRYLQFVRTLVGEGAAAAGFSDDDRGRIELAAVEGFTNVIRHVYRDRHDRPVALRLTVPVGVLRLEIEDHGTFVDPATIASRPLGEIRPGGLGVHLMRTTMDVVDYRRNAHGGTTLTLEKRRAPRDGDAR
jgi:serine/threonine-protein kinase RsbW